MRSALGARDLVLQRSEAHLPTVCIAQNCDRRAGAVEDDGADPRKAFDLAVLVTERGISSARPR